MADYVDFVDATVSVLQTQLLPSYANLETRKGVWDPRRLATFERYLVFVAIPLTDLEREVRVQASKLVNEIVKAEIYLLVKNYDEDKSLYGKSAPDLGVIKLFDDAKDVLRNTDLGGLLERTYREIEGGTAFESGASGGFDTGKHEWVHRIRFTYTAMMQGFCHPA